MGRLFIYQATNEKSGITHTGTAKELSEILKISVSTVNYASATGKATMQGWKIEKTGECKDSYYKMPPEFAAEWDEVTRPFKKASQKAQRIKGARKE